MSGGSPTAGIFHPFLVSSLVYPLERKELEVILLVEPATLEELERQAGPSGQGERVDGELNVGVSFLFCFRLVVEDVDVTVADLQEIDMTGNAVALEIEIETALPVVTEILSGEEHRKFHCDGDRIIYQHEALQCLVSLLVVRCGWHSESCGARGMVLFACDRRTKFCRELR